VKSKGLAPEIAAKMVIFYYVGLALGRFLSGVFAKKLTSWNIIHISFGVLGMAVLLVILPVPYVAVACVGLFLIGLGNGPMYPNLAYLTPKHFGEEMSQSVIGSQVALSYVGIMIVPALFGLIAQVLSTDAFPYYILVLFIGFFAAMCMLKRALKREYGIRVK